MKRIPLIFLSALLLIASFPPFNLYLLAWVGLAPLLFAVDGIKLSRAFLYGFISAAVFFLGTVYWLIHVTLPGMIAVVLYLALYPAVFTVIASRLIARPSYKALFTIPAIWVATEYARSHIFGGFGWNLLAHSQSGNLQAIQIADVTGAYGVSYLILLVNAAIFFTIKDIKKRNYSTFYLAVTMILVFISLGYGKIRINNIFTGEELKVAVIQGNIPQNAKWDPSFRSMIIEKYAKLTGRAVAMSPDIIVWPEASVPGFLESEKDLLECVSSLARNSGSALLVGEPRLGGDDKESYYNSATLFNKEGVLLANYDKVHLVPFGEFIPAKKIFSFVEKFTKATIGDFSSGKEYTVFDFSISRQRDSGDRKIKLIKKVKLSAMICFEDIFPEIAREFVRRGAVFLVAMTNDAWFGRSGAPYQHVQSSVFRAVENRVNVVRAANTGVSCFIDQKGSVSGAVASGRDEIFVDGISVRDIVLTNTRTLYTVYGDIFAYLCVIISVLQILFVWKDGRID